MVSVWSGFAIAAFEPGGWQGGLGGTISACVFSVTSRFCLRFTRSDLIAGEQPPSDRAPEQRDTPNVPPDDWIVMSVRRVGATHFSDRRRGRRCRRVPGGGWERGAGSRERQPWTLAWASA